MRPTPAAVADTPHDKISFGFCAQDPQPCVVTGRPTCWRATLPDGSSVPLVEAECTAAGWKRVQAAWAPAEKKK